MASFESTKTTADLKSSYENENTKTTADLESSYENENNEPQESDAQIKSTTANSNLRGDPSGNPSGAAETQSKDLPNTPTSHTLGWVPRCPHCDTPNEYDRVMCDPVLPRMCQGGYQNGDDEQVDEIDRIWHDEKWKVFSWC